MKKQRIIIATRESPLALRQTEWVKHQLMFIYPKLNIELLGLTTHADRLLSMPLAEVGGKGLFVKELEEALLESRADIAVHSMKDMPMDLPSGLMLAAVCEREEARDVLVSNDFTTWEELPLGARVGTSSLRRQSQLYALRPDLRIENLRGNVNTRLACLDKGDFDALVLAAAGLKRLDYGQRISSYFSLDQILPAVGQGILAIECRSNDQSMQLQFAPLNHQATWVCAMAERAMCKRLGGGCSAPVAAYAELRQDHLELRGLVASLDGKMILRARHQALSNQAQVLGETVAIDLLDQGADKILRAFFK